MSVASGELTTLPRVTCGIATYNFERFLPRAIESALAQDYPPELLEIVVVDDGSTDGTPEVVVPYLDRIRYIRKENGGLISSVDRLLHEATGEFIAFLSGDDEWMPHKTRTQAEALVRNPELGLVYSDLEVIDDDGRPVYPSYWAMTGIRPVRGRVSGRLLDGNVVSGGTIMVRSSLRDRIHPIGPEAPYEDWWIAVRVAQVAPIDYVPEPLYRYRFHGANMNLDLEPTPAKRAEMQRAELPFRRWLFQTARPGDATPQELFTALQTFMYHAGTTAKLLGVPVEELLPVTDDERILSSRRLRDAAEHARRGAQLEALHDVVAAVALDPWNTAAQESLGELSRTPASPPPASAAEPVLESRRERVIAAFADELAMHPDMLTTYANAFWHDERTTLVICGRESSDAALLERLLPIAERAGLAAEDGPDVVVLAMPDQRFEERLAQEIDAIYSRVEGTGAFGGMPRIDDRRADQLAAAVTRSSE